MLKKILWVFLCLMVFSTGEAVFAASNKTPLPSDQAFKLSIIINHANAVTAKWDVAPGYYLYRQRLHISLAPKTDAEILFPQGKIKHDPRHVDYEVYTGKVIIPILLQTTAKQLQLTLDYQGCSESGFCYPPMSKHVWLDLANQTISSSQMTNASASPVSLFSLLTSHNDVRALFATQHFIVILLIFTALGLLLAFTPCVLPMIPILTSIIVGHKQAVSTKKAFFLSASYVLGSSLTYAIAGVIAAAMGSSLQVWLQQTWIIVIVSGLFVLLAFSLFDFYELRLPKRWQNRVTSLSRKQEGGTYLGVFIMGIVSTLIVSPCVTAPLVGVLMYIAQTGDKVLGASALFAMGIGMGIPLLLIGVSAGKLIPRRGPWMNAIKKLFGFIMLVMAAWMLSRVAFLPQSTTQVRPFIVVHDMVELNKQLSIAHTSQKPVLLDFYADWCESCVTMDRNVFNMPNIQQALKGFILLRADLTANSKADEALLKNYNVVAPPTVLFFNNYGQEVNAHRIVGEVNAKEFTTRLNTFITASCDKKLQC